MSTRYLIAALLMTSACVAQADVLPASDTAGSSLVQALYGKTSADQSGAVTVNLADGVEGPYVIGTSNTIMAAMLGYGMSSVFHKTSADVAPVSYAAPDSATVAAPAAVVAAAAPAAVAAEAAAEATADTGVTGGSNQDVSAPATGALADISGTPGTVADATDVGIAAAEVPEPSSIALMMAGMAGALALGRRRRNR
jgi:hypothetical protein